MDTPESSQAGNEIIEDPVESEADREIVYFGIDLGTSAITVSSSNGSTLSEHSLIAHLRSPASEIEGENEVFFGKAALERADTELSWPVRDLMHNTGNCEDLKKLIEHCIRAVGAKAGPEHSYAIISVHSGADVSYKKAILEVSRPLFKGVMVANGPICAAYGDNKLERSIIIDMGAIKTDICRIQDNIPEDRDILSVPVAGENIDQELVSLLAEKYEGSKVTRELARKWKETYGFVGAMDEECRVELPVESSSQEAVISEEVRLACESIIPDIVSGILKMVSGAEPQFRDALRDNIYLCGGSSKIRNISEFLEKELRELGGGSVFLMDNPETAAACGACRLAEKMPGEFWERLSNCDDIKTSDVIL